jgi:hypothetical protein
VTRCHKGGGPSAPPAPLPPNPQDAEAAARKRVEERQRHAYGFRKTILTQGLGSANAGVDNLKSILGG